MRWSIVLIFSDVQRQMHAGEGRKSHEVQAAFAARGELGREYNGKITARQPNHSKGPGHKGARE